MVTDVCLLSHRFQHGGGRLPNTDGKICFFLAGRVCFSLLNFFLTAIIILFLFAKWI